MPRKSIAIRGIVLVAVAGLAVAACTPPLPPDVLAAQAEKNIVCQSGNVNVGVPEAFAGSMTAVGDGLTGVCPDQTVTEVGPTDDAKVELVDHAPSAEKQAEFAKTCPSGSVIIVPAFGYAVALAFNIIGLEGLVLTPQAIAGILNGTVTSWEDPLITDPNAGYDLSGLADISVLSEEQETGSVVAMTTWLSATAPDAWTAGPVGTIDTGTKFPTQADLLSELTATEGTVAVLPAFTSIANGIPVASVPVGDLTISPDDTQLLKVGAGATTITVADNGNITASPAIGGVPVEGSFDLAASKIVLAEGQPLVGWPIVGMAHLMVCDDPADPLPLSFAQYVVRLAGQGGLEAYGVTPLPEPIRLKTFAPLKVTASAPGDGASVAPSSSVDPSDSAVPSDAAPSAAASPEAS